MARTMLESGAISAFCGSVATMLSAGIQTDEALMMLADGRESSRFQEVCATMYRLVAEGMPFARAAERSEGFPRYAVEMMDTGEQSGHLEPVLRNLEMYYDEEDHMFAELRMALGYPAALLAIMTAILLFTSLFVVPVFNSVFQGMAATLTTASLLSITFSCSIGWIALALTVVCTVGALYLLLSSVSQRGRERVLALLERVPLTSHALYQLALSRFTASLATYVSSGMAGEEALARATATVGNELLHRRLEAAHEAMVDLDHPLSLAQAISEQDVLEPLYARMITVGVRSGSIDETLSQLSRTFFDDAVLQIDHVLDQVEPLIAAFLTCAVGATLIAVMLPLVGIMGSIG